MDTKLFKLINKARSNPSGFIEQVSNISFLEGKAVIDLQKWSTQITSEDISAVKNLLTQSLPEVKPARFINNPTTLVYPRDYHILLICIDVCLQCKDMIFDLQLAELAVVVDVSSDKITVRLSFKFGLAQSMTKTQTFKMYEQKARKIAYEIIGDSKLRKRYKILMLKGNEWINELAKNYGPFTGYELNEFITWFKTAEKEIPKQKAIPKATEPKPPVLAEKIVVNEGGVIPQGTVVIKKPQSPAQTQNPLESTTNGFCVGGENVKFTFKAKQRYNDIKTLIKKTNGNINEHMVNTMPEKECEETLKEPPISVPEKYEAFLLEEVLIAAPPPKSEVPTKPMFTTNFNLPDNLKIKTETARMQSKNDNDILSEPYQHKFREEFDPMAVGKPDFILRLPKPEQAKIERISEPLEKIKLKQKEEKLKMEAEEKVKRTELYGKSRGEWVSTFKPISSFLEMGTGEPHRLLPKDEYIELFKTSSRAS